MNKRIRHIYYVLILAVATSLVGSLTHYHNEGMECLVHHDEAHYIQNDINCPVCSLVIDHSFDHSISAETTFYPDGFVVVINETYLSPFSFLAEPGRAPPFVV